MSPAKTNERRAAKTHCVHGHELVTVGTYTRPDGTRTCMECQRIRCRQRDAACRERGHQPRARVRVIANAAITPDWYADPHATAVSIDEWKIAHPGEWERISRAATSPLALGQVESAGEELAS